MIITHVFILVFLFFSFFVHTENHASPECKKSKKCKKSSNFRKFTKSYLYYQIDPVNLNRYVLVLYKVPFKRTHLNIATLAINVIFINKSW